MAYADQQMSGNRIIAIILVVLIHLALGYALITGLAYSAVSNIVERVTTIDIEEPEPEEPEEEPPPPEPVDAPPPPVAPPPPINVAVAPPPIRTQVTIQPPAPPRLIVPPPAPVAPPAPPAPPAPSQARGVTPDGQSRWAARIQENYPATAVRREIEGSVGVTVQIGTDGRVTGCTVSRSSGESVLDEAACQGMQRYARYNPALNAAGDPIPASTSTTIVYRLD